MQDIDFKRLIEQEPEFAEFCKSVIFETFFTGNPESETVIKMLHNFYQLGTSTSDVVRFIRNMNQGSV